MRCVRPLAGARCKEMRSKMRFDRKHWFRYCAAVAAICCLGEGIQLWAQTDGPSSSSVPDAPSASQLNFAQRWAQYYSDDWSGKNVSTAAPPEKRGLPAPLDSPPFPNSDWSYGGSPDIGAPDGNVYPLMSALNGAKSRTKVYGWIEPGLNFSTSSKNNFPDSYTVFPNKLELDQAVVYIERLADTVQTKHFDWGYH